MSRMGLRNVTASVAFVVLCLTAVSCSVNQTIFIKADGSGTASIRVEVSKLLQDYLVSLAAVSGHPDVVKTRKVFDLNEIRKSFQTRPGITINRIESPTPDSLEMDLSYLSIKDAFASDDPLKSTGVIVFSETDEKKTLSMHLDKNNYKRLSAIFPILADPLFSALGPQPGSTIGEDEYLKMVKFSMGPDGPVLLKQSFVLLVIQPEGEIIAQSGGIVSNGTVTFKIPLLSILVLEKPLDYSVSFK